MPTNLDIVLKRLSFSENLGIVIFYKQLPLLSLSIFYYYEINIIRNTNYL